MSQKNFVVCLVIGLMMLVITSAHAQPTAANRAAAEALFEQAQALMAEKKAEEACPKFEESQRLDPGVGTLLYLADCYETVGRTASAWATFLQAGYAAKNAGQTDRQQIAEENAERIKPKLSKLVLVVANPSPGLTITADGQELAEATWGTEMPVDPGPHELNATAENKKPWTTSVTIQPGPGVTRIEVPTLEDAPEEPVAAAAPPAGETTPPATAAPTAPPAAPPAADQGGGGSGLRTVGWVAVLAGGTGLVASGLFTFLAVSDNGRADDNCRVDEPNLCGERGVDLGDSAARKANTATVLAGVGGALAIGGVVLIFTAPKDRHAGLRVGTQFAGNSGKLLLEGRW